MTPVGKWLRNKVEEWLGKRYEGPEPPERLRLEVLSFAETCPTATRSEWAEFAEKFAREAYRVGYVRGFEWTERDKDAWSAVTPDELADQMDPGWREWSPPIVLSRPNEVVPEVMTDAMLLDRALAPFRRKR